MKLINADVVFSKTSFQDDIDYETYPVSVYQCPICNEKLSFNKRDFQKHSLQKTSVLSYEEQTEIEEYLHKINQQGTNSFIDFYCPQCKTPTRIYYESWAGGRFTGGYILKFLIYIDR